MVAWLLAIVSWPVRWALFGRVRNVAVAYPKRHPASYDDRSPLDYVIPYLAERYPDPASLVIATNYEEPAFMFYLGSRVLVGFSY